MVSLYIFWKWFGLVLTLLVVSERFGRLTVPRLFVVKLDSKLLKHWTNDCDLYRGFMVCLQDEILACQFMKHTTTNSEKSKHHISKDTKCFQSFNPNKTAKTFQMLRQAGGPSFHPPIRSSGVLPFKGNRQVNRFWIMSKNGKVDMQETLFQYDFLMMYAIFSSSTDAAHLL